MQHCPDKVFTVKLYFNYSIDCELPLNTPYTGPEQLPSFGGPKSWEFAEASVRSFAERMAAMDAAGVEIALYLNGLRYSRRQPQHQSVGDPSTYQAQNLEWTVWHVRKLAEQYGLELTPASFLQMTEEAERINSY